MADYRSRGSWGDLYVQVPFFGRVAYVIEMGGHTRPMMSASEFWCCTEETGCRTSPLVYTRQVLRAPCVAAEHFWAWL